MRGKEESLCSCLVSWFDEGSKQRFDLSFLKSFVAAFGL